MKAEMEGAIQDSIWANTVATEPQEPKKSKLSLATLDKAIKKMYAPQMQAAMEAPSWLPSGKSLKPWTIDVPTPVSTYYSTELTATNLKWEEYVVYAHTKDEAAEALHKYLKEEPLPPTMHTNAKLMTWGCPSCGVKEGTWVTHPDIDAIRCGKCDKLFTHQWLMHWDGHTQSNYVEPDPGPAVSNPPYMTEDLYERLFEKVVAFREAVINPDRVMDDEQIESLMTAMFDASYSIAHSAPGDMDDDGLGETLLAPDNYDSEAEYSNALSKAVMDGTLTVSQAKNLLKTFGGDDPFPTAPKVSQEELAKFYADGAMTPEQIKAAFEGITGVSEVSKGQVGDIDGLNFAEALDEELDWIDPYDGEG